MNLIVWLNYRFVGLLIKEQRQNNGVDMQDQAE